MIESLLQWLLCFIACYKCCDVISIKMCIHF